MCTFRQNDYSFKNMVCKNSIFSAHVQDGKYYSTLKLFSTLEIHTHLCISAVFKWETRSSGLMCFVFLWFSILHYWQSNWSFPHLPQDAAVGVKHLPVWSQRWPEAQTAVEGSLFYRRGRFVHLCYCSIRPLTHPAVGATLFLFEVRQRPCSISFRGTGGAETN